MRKTILDFFFPTSIQINVKVFVCISRKRLKSTSQTPGRSSHWKCKGTKMSSSSEAAIYNPKIDTITASVSESGI